MHIVTSNEGTVVQEQNSVGSEMVTTDKEGVEIGRRPLTDVELAQIATESQPTSDETLVANLEAATDLDGVKAALIERFGG